MLELSSGQSVKFEEGFYKVIGVDGVLIGTVGAVPTLTLRITPSATIVGAAVTDWFNVNTAAPLAAADTAGDAIIPALWSSQPVISAGQTLELAASTGANICPAKVTVTIAKVGNL
jgi:hypothetical protein